MTIAHSLLTGADLHEPKGSDSATADSVYVADGAGSGTWEKITDDSIDLTSIFTTNMQTLMTYMADVSTAGQVYLPVPWNANLVKIYTSLGGALTGADAILTAKNSAGATIGTITVAFTGSGAGDVDSLTATTNNSFTAGQFVEIETDGASTGTQPIWITLTFTLT